MLRLLILRHALAAPAGSGPDFDRALTAEGRAEARKIGAFLESRGIVPGFAAISPARRAVETWQAVRSKLSVPPAETIEPKLYDASAGTLLDVARKIDGRNRTALIVGHNPGLEALTITLTGGALRMDKRYLTEKFAPCALVITDFDIENWDELSPGKGVLSLFVTPAGISEK
jgi:phosphohistidine phosphatase